MKASSSAARAWASGVVTFAASWVGPAAAGWHAPDGMANGPAEGGNPARMAQGAMRQAALLTSA
ncbi:hypothetical protein GCM10025795_53670 [Verticiella sediminum]